MDKVTLNAVAEIIKGERVDFELRFEKLQARIDNLDFADPNEVSEVKAAFMADLKALEDVSGNEIKSLLNSIDELEIKVVEKTGKYTSDLKQELESAIQAASDASKESIGYLTKKIDDAQEGATALLEAIAEKAAKEVDKAEARISDIEEAAKDNIEGLVIAAKEATEEAKNKYNSLVEKAYNEVDFAISGIKNGIDGIDGVDGRDGEKGLDGIDRQLINPIKISENQEVDKGVVINHRGGLFQSTRKAIGDPTRDPHAWENILTGLTDVTQRYDASESEIVLTTELSTGDTKETRVQRMPAYLAPTEGHKSINGDYYLNGTKFCIYKDGEWFEVDICGKDGERGPKGRAGIAGVGIDDFIIDGSNVTVLMTDGQIKEFLLEITAPPSEEIDQEIKRYAGNWHTSKSYVKGDVVTSFSGLYVCLKNTSKIPDNSSNDWALMHGANQSLGGGDSIVGLDFPPVTININPPNTGNHGKPIRAGDLWFDADQLALYVATKNTNNEIVWVICVPAVTGVESTQTASLPVAWPKAVDGDEYTNPLTNIVYVFNEPKKQWINVPEHQQQHEDFDPHIKDHICAEFFKVLKDSNAVEAASGSTMASYKFDDNRIKYWVKPPKKDFFSNVDSIYINEDGPFTIEEVTSSNKWTTFFIAGGLQPAVGTTCTLSKTRKLCTELNHLQNEIIELEKEMDAIAPTLYRGLWRFNPAGSASPAMFAMYAMGTTTSEFAQADQVFINTVSTDGTLHNFNDVEVGSYLEIFSPNDGDYGLYKVTGKSDETGGANAFWMFDVEHSRSNRPMADASMEDTCRFKFFTIADTAEPTSFVMKTGDSMTGDLNMVGSKVKTLFLDSGQNSNLAIQHDGNTKVYVGNTQTSFINHIKLNRDGVDDDHVVTKKYVDQGFQNQFRAEFFEVVGSYSLVEDATAPSMAHNDFGGGQIKYWVKPPTEGFFKNGESIYINDKGPYPLSQVTGGNKWNTFFITNGPRPIVGTTCTFSTSSLTKIRELFTETTEVVTLTSRGNAKWSKGSLPDTTSGGYVYFGIEKFDDSSSTIASGNTLYLNKLWNDKFKLLDVSLYEPTGGSFIEVFLGNELVFKSQLDSNTWREGRTAKQMMCNLTTHPLISSSDAWDTWSYYKVLLTNMRAIP